MIALHRTRCDAPLGVGTVPTSQVTDSPVAGA